MKEERKIPELRFPEFEGAWDNEKIGKIFSVSAGGDVPKENVSEVKTEEFKYPIYANAEKGKGFYAYSDIFKVEAGVVTVAGRGVNIGIAHARDHRFYPIVRLLVLKPKQQENIYFFEHSINNLNLYIESTGVPQLTAPQISSYRLSYPSLPEQQKIATFLTAVDDKIQQLTRKKSLLEDYKKGVMQQIFSQQIRFKADNGSNFPEWEEKKLDSIVSKITNGISLDQNSEQIGYRVTRIETISDGTINLAKVGYVDTQKDISSYRLLEGDLLFSNINSVAHIGKIVRVDSDFNLYHGMNLLNIRVDKAFDNQFIYYQLSRKQMKNYFERICNRAVNQASINQTDLKKTIVLCPCLEEQHKIADFLSALDTKIEQVNTQLEQTKTFKKGLLQKMFV
ncbi:restriction endonuclease subunit S [uncultured Draconibacterium sp.]|uniref:restriction endonuclease subunit S n=1 Tax=uncultured Draconibacterium sp. TaxID=1573823 RepID=UPI0025CBDD8D|nr:restriction endonuclease subunit S [uncultured Draconibacterium sp.]